MCSGQPSLATLLPYVGVLGSFSLWFLSSSVNWLLMLYNKCRLLAPGELSKDPLHLEPARPLGCQVSVSMNFPLPGPAMGSRSCRKMR